LTGHGIPENKLKKRDFKRKKEIIKDIREYI